MQLKIGYLFQCPPRAAPWVYIAISKAPCRGKSFINHLVLKLLPLQGDEFGDHENPGRCPGLGASALSGRVGLLSIPQSYGFIFKPARDFGEKLQKKLGSHALYQAKNLCESVKSVGQRVKKLKIKPQKDKDKRIFCIFA